MLLAHRDDQHQGRAQQGLHSIWKRSLKKQVRDLLYLSTQPRYRPAPYMAVANFKQKPLHFCMLCVA
jgi:hypothetical protein